MAKKPFKLRLNKARTKATLTLNLVDMEQVLASYKDSIGCWDPDDEHTAEHEDLAERLVESFEMLPTQAFDTAEELYKDLGI